ncbi:Retrovirus-related Pol polyprotein from type-2 retrotransposable element R2DM; Endonuclease [Eumeta japonica]|uniref:Retrovirus-related Pol polyprotein from type-2 retrotransposable element R2DM Endonuclease n=1 Tax=Eumeta variegata TaxID=151549 RepID=A0A4C1UM76_EUMVA|nr:Retrovirus-related Pol polyprotein from type-2 retrotransposable element R2DM; Endonuclease [Eumeta japonica]
MDHIHTLELIIEKYQEFQRPLYVAFIDYQKAFDTVSHHSIWKSLEAQNVEKSYIDVIRKVYEKCTSRVKLETTGPTFPVERGVRQGDPLSPRIFIAILETALGDLDWSKKGLYIKGKYLSHLRFADDLVLFSESSSQLQVMIEDLCKTSRQVGLEINISKTKLMSNDTKKDINLKGGLPDGAEPPPEGLVSFDDVNDMDMTFTNSSKTRHCKQKRHESNQVSKYSPVSAEAGGVAGGAPVDNRPRRIKNTHRTRRYAINRFMSGCTPG